MPRVMGKAGVAVWLGCFTAAATQLPLALWPVPT